MEELRIHRRHHGQTRADVMIGTYENNDSTPGSYEAVFAGYNLGPP